MVAFVLSWKIFYVEYHEFAWLHAIILTSIIDVYQKKNFDGSNYNVSVKHV
jgi:hypothetical protein